MTQKLQNHLANGYDVKIGDYISQGFEIFKKNAGGFIGYTALYFVMTFIMNFIPFLGVIGSIVISPCLSFGFYLVAKQTDEGKLPDFGAFFKGFDYFNKIAVISLIIFGVALLMLIPIFLFVGFNIMSFGNSREVVNEFMASGSIGIIVIAIFALAFLVSCWVFAPLFAVFHNMEAWQAMETSRKLVMKNWLMILLFLIVVGLVVALGAIPCLLGLIVTLPIAYCSLYVAFKDLAGLPEDENRTDEIQNIGNTL